VCGIEGGTHFNQVKHRLHHVTFTTIAFTTHHFHQLDAYIYHAILNTPSQKRIKLLENRLERAYVKFNQSITHNKQLREQINNLRRERIMFESIHSNLERELVKVKKDMAETIQIANQVCEGSMVTPVVASVKAFIAFFLWRCVQTQQAVILDDGCAFNCCSIPPFLYHEVPEYETKVCQLLPLSLSLSLC
jgi:hypothetical protein